MIDPPAPQSAFTTAAAALTLTSGGSGSGGAGRLRRPQPRLCWDHPVGKKASKASAPSCRCNAHRLVVRRPRTPRRAAVLFLLAQKVPRRHHQCLRWITIFKNMPRIKVISPFFFYCCVFRGRVRRRSAVLKEAPHHAAHHHTTQCSRGRLYLAAHVLLLSWKAAVLSAGLVGWRKRYDPDFGSRLQQSSVDVLSLIGRNSP